MPDIDPTQLPRYGHFSMAAGDFMEVYTKEGWLRDMWWVSCVLACERACVHACLRVLACACVCLRVCVRVCVHVCVCVRAYICACDRACVST